MTADVDRVLADLAGDGVAVIAGVLAPDACVEALERLWAASRRAEEQGIRPTSRSSTRTRRTCACST